MKAPRKSAQTSVSVGDVVTLQGQEALMTVEAVRQDTFGLVLECIWFDANDGLRFRRHPLAALDLFPRPELPRALKRGMEVRLRSRGPVMTVRSVGLRDGAMLADCIWTGPMGRERRRFFPVDTLVLTIFERFPDGKGGSF